MRKNKKIRQNKNLTKDQIGLAYQIMHGFFKNMPSVDILHSGDISEIEYRAFLLVKDGTVKSPTYYEAYEASLIIEKLAMRYIKKQALDKAKGK